MPFSLAAGIPNPPASMQMVPTIAEVMQNMGGFKEKVASYNNHEIIHLSPWGQYPISGKMMYDYMVYDMTNGGHLDTGNEDSYWDKSTYDMGDFVYSNAGWTMLGELVRVHSGKTYERYIVDNFLTPLGIENRIFADPGHRHARDVPPKAGMRSYLSNSTHFYHSVECNVDADCGHIPNGACGPDNMCTGCTRDDECTDDLTCVAGTCRAEVRTGSQSVPPPLRTLDSSPRWFDNAGPVDAAAPRQAAAVRYAGAVYMGGAPLAAGGWYGDGEAVGRLIREFSTVGALVPLNVAAQLWAPQWFITTQNKAPSWAYALGWYVRGNWLAWAGGSDGAMSMVLHNRAYDFTVVYLANVVGNGFGEFIDPLLDTSGMGWSVPGNANSALGGPFPCIDDPMTIAPECSVTDPY